VSGSRPNPAASGLAEQHLGDRLSALVDGELGPDARERVLAHVATCPKCKAEVDAQRRLKNVFAEAAPPPPSESFLARLQGLPWGGDPEGGGPPPGGGGLPGALPGPGRSGALGVFGVKRGEPFEFGYVPARPHLSEPAPQRSGGFRVHPVGRPEGERSALRGLRFAFVAAGAVSLAALALGGVTTGTMAGTAAEARGGSGAGSNVTPARPAGTHRHTAGRGEFLAGRFPAGALSSRAGSRPAPLSSRAGSQPAPLSSRGRFPAGPVPGRTGRPVG